MQKVLVLGGSGLVGSAIIAELNRQEAYQVHASYFEIPLLLNHHRSFKLNIEDAATLHDILDTVKPHRVISCLRGDFTNQLALHTKVAEFLRETGGRLYFLSTANVFDNDRSKPHDEDDVPNSCTEYGQYKITCEKAITEILQEDACILRLPQVWGTQAPRMNQLLRSLQSEERVVVYPKLYCNTTIDVLVAKQIRHIMENELTGIFHLAAEDAVGNRDFYEGLIRGLGFQRVNIKENFGEVGYFVLSSKRTKEFPEGLRLTNQAVIDYLTAALARAPGEGVNR